MLNNGKEDELMDNNTVPPVIQRRDGFVGQRQYVLPPAMIASLEIHPLLRSLFPTDIGWYPDARYHYRKRSEGAREHILIFCLDGEGWCEIGDQRLTIHQQEALVIPRGIGHCYGASEEKPWSIHWVHFRGSSGDLFAHQLPEHEYSLKVDPKTAETLSALFTECYDSFIGGFVTHRLIYCSQVLHHLLGQMFFGNRAFSPLLRTSHFHNIEDTLHYLEKHIATRLTLEAMAEHAGLSISHFAATFKQQTGYSPVDYFIQLKMQYACSQLTLSNKTIQHIASEVGYDDPYYFSRIFKKVVGLSPHHYRTHL